MATRARAVARPRIRLWLPDCLGRPARSFRHAGFRRSAATNV